MGKLITFSDSEIGKAIAYHKFVALVEVTNGITQPWKRQEKKKQVKKGRKIMKKAFGDEVQVSGGLALIRNTQKSIKELDFLIEVPQYHFGVLSCVIDELLKTDYLNERDQFYLKALANHPRTLLEKLNPPAHTRKGTSQEYIDRLSHIKGAVLEHYVKELFDQVLEHEYTFSLGTKITDYEPTPQQTIETDLLIACPPTMFEESLERLTKLYSGRQRIKVRPKRKEKFPEKSKIIRPRYSHARPY